jgi:hypothetical protein
MILSENSAGPRRSRRFVRHSAKAGEMGSSGAVDPSIARAFRGRRFAAFALERLSTEWNPSVDKKSLEFKVFEHVLIEKVSQLFRNML